MKKFIYNLLNNIFIVFFVITIVQIFNFKLSTNAGSTIAVNYVIYTLTLWSLALLLVDPILKFLTVTKNFITTFLVVTLLSIGFLYLIDWVMPVVTIHKLMISRTDLGIILLQSFVIGKNFAIMLVSVIVALIKSTMFVLQK